MQEPNLGIGDLTLTPNANLSTLSRCSQGQGSPKRLFYFTREIPAVGSALSGSGLGGPPHPGSAAPSSPETGRARIRQRVRVPPPQAVLRRGPVARGSGGWGLNSRATQGLLARRAPGFPPDLPSVTRLARRL